MQGLSRPAVSVALAVAFLVAAVLTDFLGGLQLSGVYATAAIIASISGRPRRTVAVAGCAVAAAAVSGLWHGTLGDWSWSVRLLSCVIAGSAAVVAARLADTYHRRVRHTSRLAQDLLDALAVELTGARTETEVADAFLGQAARRLGVASANILLLGQDRVLRSVAWLGRGGSQADQFTELSLDADLPGAAAARTQTPLHFADRAAIEAAFPTLVGYYTEERSLHVLPLVHHGSMQGLLALTFPPRVVDTDDERGLLVSLARALSAALARAEALVVADGEIQRAAILSEASRALSRSLDWDETLAEVSRLLVPDLADWCSLYLLRDGTLETAAVWHHDPDTTAWAQGMRGIFPVDMTAPTGAPAVVRTGEPELYVSVPEELLVASATNDEHAEILKRLGLVSALVAPMRSRGRVTGAVSLAYADSGRHYGEADLQLVVDLASRIGTALDNAENFTTQSRRLTEVTKVAAAAQRAILSPPPSHIGPLTLSARYVSAAEEAQVGGDLYEVVPRSDRVRVLIGDVRGKGLSAVRTATIALGGFRSAAVQDLTIEEVAQHLDNHVQVYLDDDEDFVTAALVDIFHDGRFSLVLCGHPSPLLANSGDWSRIEATPSAPLGLGSTPRATHGTMQPGDRMLLFTDGLLEARRADRTFIDPAPLWAMVGSQQFSVLLDAILEAVQLWTGGRLQDDLALLTIQYQEPAGLPAPSQVVQVLPASGASVGAARAMVRELLQGSRMQTVVEDAELAISELVTNALVHAGGDVHLTLGLTDSGLRVDVGDRSPHPPQQRDYAVSSATGRGLHLLDGLVSRWGTFPLGRGKVVWFEVDDPQGRPPSADEPSADPSLTGEVDHVSVELLNVPLLMHAAWQEHASALLRELLLVRLGEDDDTLGRHAQASDALNVLYEQVPAPDLGEDPGAVMANALEPQVSSPSITVRIPEDSLAHFLVLDEMITDALTLAATGRLLVPPTQPEIRQMSRWLCHEVVAQGSEGRAPSAWTAPEPVQVTDTESVTVDGWDSTEVSASSRALLATNAASVIVAVSPSALRFLEYAAAEDLVGRPIICVVPPRYHQAHIAGTTLHTVNGRDPLLGVHLTVPVVSGRGEEKPVELMVVSLPVATGERVFLAEFFLDDPAELSRA